MVTGLILVVLCIIGFLLRAQETISGNFLFLLDSGRDMMDVKRIVFDHRLTLIGPYTSLGGVFQGPFYYYLLAIPTAIFGGNPWGNILLMLLLSLSVLGIVFYCMRKFFGTIPASVTLALFTFSPEAIAAATYFWNPHPMWVILVLYIFVLYGAIKGNGKMQLFLWPLILLSFHFQMAFGVFLLITTFLYLFFFHRHLFSLNKIFVLSILLSIGVLSPQIIFDLRHDFLMTRSVVKIFQGKDQGLISGGEKANFNAFANNSNTIKHNFTSAFIYEKEFGKFPIFILILFVITLVYSMRKKYFSKDEKLFIHILFSIIGIIILLSILYPFPLRYWFLTGFQSFYLVLSGIVLSKLFKFRLGQLLLIGILLFHIFYSVERIDTLYFNPPDDGGYAKIKGKLHAIDYIYKNAGDEKFGLLVFTPPVLTDAYDYLVWWHGLNMYQYIPHEEKKGLVYLLIEPDPGNPSSYQGWLETVIKTGEVVDTKTLPSGIIIQKRLF